MKSTVSINAMESEDFDVDIDYSEDLNGIHAYIGFGLTGYLSMFLTIEQAKKLEDHLENAITDHEQNALEQNNE
jgi:hypothetical protein